MVAQRAGANEMDNVYVLKRCVPPHTPLFHHPNAAAMTGIARSADAACSDGPGCPPHPDGSTVPAAVTLVTVAFKNEARHPAATSVGTSGTIPALCPASCGAIVRNQAMAVLGSLPPRNGANPAARTPRNAVYAGWKGWERRG